MANLQFHQRLLHIVLVGRKKTTENLGKEDGLQECIYSSSLCSSEIKYFNRLILNSSLALSYNIVTLYVNFWLVAVTMRFDSEPLRGLF